MDEGEDTSQRMPLTTLLMWVGGLTMVAAIAVPAFIRYISLPSAAEVSPVPARSKLVPALIQAPTQAPFDRHVEVPGSTPLPVDANESPGKLKRVDPSVEDPEADGSSVESTNVAR